MDERVIEHLERLNMYYQRLLKIQEMSCEAFVADDVIATSTERYLQLAIESCLNVGNRTISLYQFRESVKLPETYADIFQQLHLLGAIGGSLRDRLIPMSKFRNRLVHLYWELEREQIHQFVREDIGDFKAFEDAIIEFYRSNPLG